MHILDILRGYKSQDPGDRLVALVRGEDAPRDDRDRKAGASTKASSLPAYLQLNPPPAPRRQPAPPTPVASAGPSASEPPAQDAPGPSAAAPPPAPAAPAVPSTSAAAAAGAKSFPGLDDCHSRVCAGAMKAMRRAAAASAAAAAASAAASASASPSATSSTEASEPGSAPPSIDDSIPTYPSSLKDGSAGLPEHCPPDTARLGKATWTFLHSVAAYYPEQPSPEQQALMRELVRGLTEFYPCVYCRDHLKEQVAATPARVESQKDFSQWLCGIHNEVNEMLGKPLFDCSRVDERWRDGPADGSCD